MKNILFMLGLMVVLPRSTSDGTRGGKLAQEQKECWASLLYFNTIANSHHCQKKFITF